ncbi:RHS repeat domain-containing protein [Planctopirus hydrillae]|uniref:RHS repeat-associated core domain-containing protein n=1 Tax=Planctopirus hydrillae TaxID=1841610 RepID=A0A1C3E4R9_9PLAN|nr:RHS repeat-associated core domain-containing protein [Planctopirus hydrillae]ODA28246.1 hypothetical protein A6X21_01210 [Planctopirus hydrillae]
METVSTYTYDGRKFQIVQEEYTDGALSETRHLYYNSGWQNLEDRLGTTPDSAAPHQHHIWGLRYIDNCLLRDRTTDSTLNERLYALQDANWNVNGIIDGVGAVQERYLYTAYGTPQVQSSYFSDNSFSNNSWTAFFGGYYSQSTTGGYFIRHRNYQPLLGQWTKRDPVGLAVESSLYNFVMSRPQDFTDPYGLVPGIPRTRTASKCVSKYSPIRLTCKCGDSTSMELSINLSVELGVLFNFIKEFAEASVSLQIQTGVSCSVSCNTPGSGTGVRVSRCKATVCWDMKQELKYVDITPYDMPFWWLQTGQITERIWVDTDKPQNFSLSVEEDVIQNTLKCCQ